MGTIIPTAPAYSQDLVVAAGWPADRRPSASARLTAQEATIARMLVEGMPERQVAAELFMSAAALRAHVLRICAKLDIPSADDLATVIGRGTMLRFDPDADGDPRADDGPSSLGDNGLTEQEAAVLRLTRSGLDARQVAAELFVGTATVSAHLAHIQAKLDADADADADVDVDVEGAGRPRG